MSNDITETEGESEVREKHLRESKLLDEGLVVRRISDKTHKRFIIYLSVGGLVLLVSGLIGIRIVTKYVDSSVTAKLDSVSAEAEVGRHVTDVEGQNKALKAELGEYKSLEEDLMARRVFDKTRSLLIAYLSFGGLILMACGIVGIKTIIDYIKKTAKATIDSISLDETRKRLESEAERKVTTTVEGLQEQLAQLARNQESELIRLAQEQAARITSASQPIGPRDQQTPLARTDAAIDYSSKMGPVRNQGAEGGSVGFAVAAALEYHVNKARQDHLFLSPRHIYYYARLKAGAPMDTDTGAFIRDAVAVLVERGAVPEDAWPYKAGEFASEPPANVASAVHYKVKRATMVHNAEQLRAALVSGGPVVGGISFYRTSFAGDDTVKTGRVRMPETNESPWGAHAICFVGYDDERCWFKFRNSWGEEWGDKGYGYLPYDYVDRFLSDAWAFSVDPDVGVSNKGPDETP